MHRSSFDSEARAFTPQRIAAVVATLAEDGVDPTQALAGSGIDPAMLSDPETRVSMAQIAAVFRNALRLTRDPAIALRAGARMHTIAYGMWGYALVSSRTGGDMLEFAAKYHRTIGSPAELRYDRERDPLVCSYEPTLSPDPRDDLYRFAVEFVFAAHLSMARDLFGRSSGCSAVRVVYPAPVHASAYRKLFRCPVKFGHHGNELQFDAAWIDRPNTMHDVFAHAAARELCEQILVDMTQDGGVASTVRRTLVEQLPWRFPTVEAMAKELSLGPRSLSRRLDAQGTSYRQILADVRRRLAIEYLRKTNMTTDEIASRLGYSDAANFRHAFLRWTGRTPGGYRTR